MNNFDKWIEILGGVINAAEKIGCSRQTIHSAKTKGILSPRLKNNMIKALAAHKINVDYKKMTLELIKISEAKND